jgi:predicted RNase H-like HicB family nuclease
MLRVRLLVRQRHVAHGDPVSMTKHHFTVVLERDPEGGFHASCPALKGCHSEGDTVDEAVANVREAIALYLESLAAKGEMIPVEDLLIKPVEVAI